MNLTPNIGFCIQSPHSFRGYDIDKSATRSRVPKDIHEVNIGCIISEMEQTLLRDSLLSVDFVWTGACTQANPKRYPSKTTVTF